MSQIAERPAVESNDQQNENTAMQASALTSRDRNFHIDSAIHEAHLLLSYAARSSIVLDREIIAAVVKAKAGGVMKEEEQIVFWTKYRELSRAVHPVTAASLRDIYNEPEENQPKPVGKWRAMRSAWRRVPSARLAVFVFRTFALVTFVAVLGFQCILAHGAYLTSDMQKTIEAIKVVDAKIQAAEKISWISEKKSAQGDNQEDVQSLKILYQERSELLARKMSDHKLLIEWNDFIKLDFWEKSRTLENVKWTGEKIGGEHEFEIVHQTNKATMTVDRLNRYVLPMLYGMLGACVYVLRSLSEKIKANIYTKSVNANMWMRIVLGMLSGLVFAWFVMPENMAGVFKSLSPFALAFLVGYNVELMFFVMDRLIQKFTVVAALPDERAASPQDRTSSQAPLSARNKPAAKDRKTVKA